MYNNTSNLKRTLFKSSIQVKILTITRKKSQMHFGDHLGFCFGLHSNSNKANPRWIPILTWRTVATRMVIQSCKIYGSGPRSYTAARIEMWVSTPIGFFLPSADRGGPQKVNQTSACGWKIKKHSKHGLFDVLIIVFSWNLVHIYGNMLSEKGGVFIFPLFLIWNGYTAKPSTVQRYLLLVFSLRQGESTKIGNWFISQSWMDILLI